MTAPTLVATYAPANWSATTTPKTASVTVVSGDILVVIASHADPATVINTPTGGTGISWTLQQSFIASGAPSIYMWTAPITTSETFTLSVARTATTDPWGFRCYRFSGSDGIGNSTKTATHTTGAPSQALTSSADNSAMLAHVSDWNESTVSGTTWRTVNSITPTAGNGLEKDKVRVSGAYSVFAALWNDVGTSGSKTLGLTAPTGMDYSMVSIEILGHSSGGTTGQIKVYNGSAFVAKPIKVWNGSAWVVKPIKRWNGSSWITTPY